MAQLEQKVSVTHGAINTWHTAHNANRLNYGKLFISLKLNSDKPVSDYKVKKTQQMFLPCELVH